VELASRNAFPAINTSLYPLTLVPHGFLWLALEPAHQAPGRRAPMSFLGRDSWDILVAGRDRGALKELLPGYLRSRPWFLEHRRRVLSASIGETKVSRGRNRALGQLLYYRAWVDKDLGKGPCRGMIMSTPECLELRGRLPRVGVSNGTRRV
jgi:hypothetical protein